MQKKKNIFKKKDHSIRKGKETIQQRYDKKGWMDGCTVLAMN
jgi:hypothetical protein